jgi:hypothetical protein
MGVATKLTFKQSLDYLDLKTETRNKLLKDIKEGRFTEIKVMGMVDILQNLTGKHCLNHVALHIDGSKYKLKFDIDDMNYTLEY